MIVALHLNKSARSKLQALVVLFKTPDRTNIEVEGLIVGVLETKRKTESTQHHNCPQ